jgi:hypothetical protein
MKTLREEVEEVIVKIQLRRGDAKAAVDDLLKQRGEEEGGNPPAIRFQNDGAEHEESIVVKAFKVGGVSFKKDDHIAAREDDGQIELENRESGKRVRVDADVYEKIKRFLKLEHDGGEFDF